jgi:hypothetical protein
VLRVFLHHSTCQNLLRSNLQFFKLVFEERFREVHGDDPISHLKKFEKRCDTIKINHISSERIKVKIPYSLAGRALDWVLNWPLGTFNSWYNFKAAFIERFGPPSIMSYNRELIFSLKKGKELLFHAWERPRGLAYELDHDLRDWMLMHSFYCGLTMSSKSYVNGQSGKTFMELTAANAHILLDGLLL